MVHDEDSQMGNNTKRLWNGVYYTLLPGILDYEAFIC